MKVALYARVSKGQEQNPENQLMELRRWASASDHEVVGEFVDEISSRDTRPKKEEVLRMIRLGMIDGVAFVALDRWGRTMSELVLEMEEFSQTGKTIISMKEGIDLSTAAGKLFSHVLAAMANFERDRTRERTLAGLARARALGRPIGKRGPDKQKRKKREGSITQKRGRGHISQKPSPVKPLQSSGGHGHE